MSQSKYLSTDKSSLFSIENDVDDDEFLRRHPNSNANFTFSDRNASVPSYTGNPFVSEPDNFEERRYQLLEKKREIEEITVESTKRSLSLLRNSEEVGIATAEELLKQREQLERTDKRLDEINTTLRFSHKHIQGIKSVFGSLKNYLSGKVDSSAVPSQYTKNSTPEVNAHTRPLSQTITSSSTSCSSVQDHPAFQIRGIGDRDDPLHGRASKSNPQQAIDQNLDEMMGSLSRLKGLAHELGEEIESQNDLLDNILPKVEKSDITIQRQNKDIKRLLK
ncbi:synaptosomal-associated protein 29kDa [Lycorma delicatula]|uniref:synaptosomal-associated protein 29kDa n=1 Tax=Lycorma delicatula TaxID=130591 RepID=UPI003F51784E